MIYKFELFFSYTKKKKKNAHKYKIIQFLSSSNFIYRVRYMIMFFMVYLYWTLCFLHYLYSFDTKN